MKWGRKDRRFWDHEVAHVVEYGVDLVTDWGTTGVVWTSYGAFGMGVDLVEGPVLAEFARAGLDVSPRQARTVDVTHLVPWRGLIGRKIQSVTVHLHEARWDEPVTGPAAVTVRCDDGPPVAAVCGSWIGPADPIYLTGDDIIILWEPEVATAVAPSLELGLGT